MRGRIVLCDIDHTVSDSYWRDCLLPEDGVDWGPYYERQGDDLPFPDMVHMVRCLQHGKLMVYGLTARWEAYRKETLSWLRLHGLDLEDVFMRPEGDYRSSPELKVALALEHFKKENIAFVIEDRTDVAQAFVAAGISVLQAHTIAQPRKGAQSYAKAG